MIHDVDVVWVQCSIIGCDFKAKRKVTVQEHQLIKHDVGDWFYCGVGVCDFKGHNKAMLKRHEKKMGHGPSSTNFVRARRIQNVGGDGETKEVGGDGSEVTRQELKNNEV